MRIPAIVLFTAVLLLCVVCVAIGPARAQSDDPVGLNQRVIELYNAGKFRAARC